MPAGAPIGSGRGIQNFLNLGLIIEQSKVPVLVDAGVGTASDAVLAMEIGCDAVLMNTAIAEARDPIRMARAMKHAVIAGREAYPRRPHAAAIRRRPVQPAACRGDRAELSPIWLGRFFRLALAPGQPNFPLPG